jgi:hypothetical protein
VVSQVIGVLFWLSFKQIMTDLGIVGADPEQTASLHWLVISALTVHFYPNLDGCAKYMIQPGASKSNVTLKLHSMSF